MIIYSYIEVLHEVSGVQKVLLDIHNGLKVYYDAKIVSYLSYNDIKHYFRIPKSEYKQIKNITELNNNIIITHERKASTRFCLYNLLPNINFKLIHVQHSIYNNLKYFSFYPQRVISISDAVTNNLISYFNVSPKRIVKIHNGIIDLYKPYTYIKFGHSDKIKIAYIARIDENKRQVEIVNKLKGKINPSIQIDFIGNGPLFNKLCETIGDNNTTFKALGFCENIHELLQSYDYIMLFSLKEGLPISLLEGCMQGKPLIINNAGGNLEIGIKDYNAFNVFSWHELIETLNNLVNVSPSQYKMLSENSRKHYMKEFEYSVMINKYIKVIEKII